MLHPLFGSDDSTSMSQFPDSHQMVQFPHQMFNIGNRIARFCIGQLCLFLGRLKPSIVVHGVPRCNLDQKVFYPWIVFGDEIPRLWMIPLWCLQGPPLDPTEHAQNPRDMSTLYTTLPSVTLGTSNSCTVSGLIVA